MNHATVIKETIDKMQQAVEHSLHLFNTLHTGKASPGMIENLQVHVEAYGASMALRELAAISTPDTRTIRIQPWDKTVVKAIEKAIQTANLGFNPISDGNLIRIPIPDLSGERRKELVKVAHKMAEESHISVRHARHFALDTLKNLQKKGDISEDDFHRLEKEIQTETDKSIEAINKHLEHKEKELTTV